MIRPIAIPATGALIGTPAAINDIVDAQIDAIVIPDSLSDLTADSTHRTVTDAEKSAWNAKSNFSGSYNDLTNKPVIPSIAGLATETYVDEAVSEKADTGHNHNDVYYTETEIDTLLSNKANSNHNHNSSYDALGTAQTKANEVQANLDEAIDEFEFDDFKDQFLRFTNLNNILKEKIKNKRMGLLLYW